ncbi:MAG: tetratricopeptide repeat protein [Candidatus Marinimicrobia bacterium]|nr:tetratricopeptide repeat protein [Candidatus Neomarinimicrobiota bacterium]
MNRQKQGGRWALGIMIFCALAGAAEAAFVITRQGRRFEGTDIRVLANGDVVLTMPQGRQTFPRAEVGRAVADKPPDFDRALAAANAGQFEPAIAALRKIISDLRGLEWDNNARMALGQILLTKGDHAEAVKIFEDLMREAPAAKENVEAISLYQEALLRAGQLDKLLLVVDETIQSGPRPAAARAQMRRGDARLAQNQAENAFLDYMRTALLFKDQKDVVPEALFKAASALEALRDQTRAKRLYQEIVNEHASSPFAAEARQKL